MSFRADRMTITNGVGVPSRPKGDHPERSWGPPGVGVPSSKKGDHPAGAGGLLPSLEVGGPSVDSRHHSARRIVADDGHQAVLHGPVTGIASLSTMTSLTLS